MKKLIVLLVFFWINSVYAGGWFHGEAVESPAYQVVIEIVSEVTDDEIRITYKLGFDGNAENFVWLMPVYSEFKGVEVADFDWEWRQRHWMPGSYRDGPLQRALLTSDNACSQLIYTDNPFSQGSGGPAGVLVELQDNHQIKPADTVADWMRENRYTVDAELEAILADYAADDVPILVMPMSGDQPSYAGETPPLTFTFANVNDQLHIPTRLIAQSAGENIQMRLWVFGDERVVPVNYDDIKMDFSDLRSPNRAITPIRFNQGPYYQHTNYESLRASLFNDPAHDAIFTEMAEANPLEDGHLSTYDYITRLFRHVGRPTGDLILKTDATAEDVSRVIAVHNYVDPLYFYGCTTERAYDDLIANGDIDLLPDNRTRIGGYSVTLPDDWVRSEGTIALSSDTTHPVSIYAPEPVDINDIIDATNDYQLRLASTPEMPMLIVIRNQVLTFYGISLNRNDFPAQISRWNPFGWGSALTFAFATPTDDWEANQDMYRAMINYIASLPYYRSDDFKHTLLLNDSFGLAFNDDWTAVTTQDDHIPQIQPRNGDDSRVRGVAFDALTTPDSNFEVRHTEILDELRTRYNLSADIIDEISTGLRENSDCSTNGTGGEIKTYTYTTDTHTGIISMLLSRESRGWIEAQASNDLWSDYEALLESMLSVSIHPQAGACG